MWIGTSGPVLDTQGVRPRTRRLPPSGARAGRATRGRAPKEGSPVALGEVAVRYLRRHRPASGERSHANPVCIRLGRRYSDGRAPFLGAPTSGVQSRTSTVGAPATRASAPDRPQRRAERRVSPERKRCPDSTGAWGTGPLRREPRWTASASPWPVPDPDRRLPRTLRGPPASLFPALLAFLCASRAPRAPAAAAASTWGGRRWTGGGGSATAAGRGGRRFARRRPWAGAWGRVPWRVRGGGTPAPG